MKVKLALLTIFLTSFLPGTAFIAATPGITDFAKTDGKYWSTLFLTLPSLVIIPFLLLAPIMSKLFPKDKIVRIGLILYVISGFGCMFSPNIWLLLIARSLAGIGAGFVIPYAGGLICDYFTGREREKLLSYAGIIMYSGNILLLLFAGFLVTVHWRLAFVISLISLLPYFLLKKYLTGGEATPIQEDVKNNYTFKDTIKFNPLIYVTWLIYFASISILYSLFINTTYIIIDNNIGNVQSISYVQCVFMCFCIISNFLVALIHSMHLRLYIAADFFAIAVGFIILSFAYTSIWYVYVGIALVGLGFGSFNNTIISVIAKYTNVMNRMNALSLSTAMMHLGQFVSPIGSMILMEMFAIKSYNELFFAQAIILLFVIVCIWISYLLKIRKVQRELVQAAKDIKIG